MIMIVMIVEWMLRSSSTSLQPGLLLDVAMHEGGPVSGGSSSWFELDCSKLMVINQ